MGRVSARRYALVGGVVTMLVAAATVAARADTPTGGIGLPPVQLLAGASSTTTSSTTTSSTTTSSTTTSSTTTSSTIARTTTVPPPTLPSGATTTSAGTPAPAQAQYPAATSTTAPAASTSKTMSAPTTSTSTTTTVATSTTTTVAMTTVVGPTTTASTTTVLPPTTTRPPASAAVPGPTAAPAQAVPAAGPAPSIVPPAPSQPASPGSGPSGPTILLSPPAAAPASLPPDQVAAALDSLARSGASTTADLLAALAPLGAFDVDVSAAALMGMGHFPVAGPAVFSDDWLAPRYTPTFHLHQGNDIFAAFDTPVRAPFDGVVTYQAEVVGGNAAYLRTADGTYYYMAHLDAFGPQPSGSAVHQGDVVGYVGDTGNAKGGAPHVHFEVHPGGGAAVNPKPFLDAWLAEARAAAPALVAAYAAAHPPAVADVASVATQTFAAAPRATAALAQGQAVAPDPASLVDALLRPLTPWPLQHEVLATASCANCGRGFAVVGG
jgi:murein DD-endopeptidase MepM/ murein hydrolase activator NlpD